MNCNDEVESNIEDCKLKQPKSVKFFSGQLLNLADFELEKNYFNEKRHLLNRVIHGSGIVCGLEVKSVELTTESCICGPEGNMETISRWIADISNGVALDCLGREIIVSKSDRYIISGKDPHQLSNNFGLYIKRKDHLTNPVPSVHVTSCDEACCYSRITEDFELVFDNLDQSVQVFFDSTTYGKKDPVVIFLIEPFEAQVQTRTVSLIIPSVSGETKRNEILELEKENLAGMNIFSSTIEELELLEGSKITVEYKTTDEEGEEKMHTSSTYISGIPNGKTSEVIKRKEVCEDYYKVWLKDCMCCEDPTDAKVLLSVLRFSEIAGEEKKVKILDEETTLFRSLVPNLKKLLDLITRKKSSGESNEKVKINSGIVEFRLPPKSFQLKKVSHELNIPNGFAPPFTQVGVVHEDDNEQIKFMDEMILPNLCANKFNITSIFDMNANSDDIEELRKLSDNQDDMSFFLMVKTFRITRQDFILGAFNFHPDITKKVKVIWYAASTNFVPPVIEDVVVPGVFGKNAQEAKSMIEGAGLVANFVPGTEGTVASQTPQAGEEVQKGTTVTLTMVEMVRVPHVVHSTGAQARITIEGAGLVVHFETAEDDSIVTSQRPEGGELVLKGTTVSLRTFEHARIVPHVIGLTLQPAQQAIRNEGLVPSGGGGLPINVVIEQRPQSGVMVEAGSTVFIRMGPPG